MTTEPARPPLPPFSRETAAQKVRLAEDAWNGRNPEAVAQAYTPDSIWGNRSRFLKGRAEIIVFLQKKWESELGYRLIKELFACEADRIAVRFAYEYHDASGAWFRAYGNENRIFASDGRMARRIASINDLPIAESARLLTFPQGRRPDDFPGLSELGL
jgi:nuclear transport factor 2 (NTF2) superfamily protein